MLRYVTTPTKGKKYVEVKKKEEEKKKEKILIKRMFILKANKINN